MPCGLLPLWSRLDVPVGVQPGLRNRVHRGRLTILIEWLRIGGVG
jgi:hypothetical protein